MVRIRANFAHTVGIHYKESCSKLVWATKPAKIECVHEVYFDDLYEIYNSNPLLSHSLGRSIYLMLSF